MTKSLGSSHFVNLRTKLTILNRDMSLREDVIRCEDMKILFVILCT